LKKIKNLGFGGPGLKIHVLKEHTVVTPLLSSKEKAAPMIFLARGYFDILGEMPENTQNGVFLGALNGFLAGEPRLCYLGCRKVDFRLRFLSG
jgi:hypothetical protein